MKTTLGVCLGLVACASFAMGAASCGNDSPPVQPIGAGGDGGDGSGGESSASGVPIACSDGQLNGGESDFDCGGSECLACNDGQACVVASDCQSGVCVDAGEGPGDKGTCVPCASHTDCKGMADTYCSEGRCEEQKANGEACGGHGECASGYCPADDGVCCDRACGGECESCLGELTGGETGTCSAITDGTDPDGECEADDPASCGANGTGCNGDDESPACQSYSSATVCAEQSCTDGAVTALRHCDGVGACGFVEPVSCGGFACNEAGTDCLEACEDDEGCVDTHYCSEGACVVKQAEGVGCTADNQCASGFCPEADGVCCLEACEGLCESCLGSATGGADGSCAPVSEGTDPFNECTLTATCDGSGACQL